MDKIVIIGGKGIAVVIAEQILNAIDEYSYNAELLGFAIDDESLGDSINDIPVISKTYECKDKFSSYNDVKFIYTLYRPDLMIERINLRNSYGIDNDKYCNFIHPSVMVSKSSKMGYGNVILANNVINPNFVMGSFNTINSSCLLGHDTVIKDNNFLAGHVCIGSNIEIGSGNFLGLNSSFRNFITIGDYNIVGMGSNVVKSIDNNSLYIGNPARLVVKSGKPIR